MAKGPRERIKRRLDAAITHCDKVMGFLIENGEEHREHHPEILSRYQTVYAFFEQGKLLLEGMEEVA